MAIAVYCFDCCRVCCSVCYPILPVCFPACSSVYCDPIPAYLLLWLWSCLRYLSCLVYIRGTHVSYLLIIPVVTSVTCSFVYLSSGCCSVFIPSITLSVILFTVQCTVLSFYPVCCPVCCPDHLRCQEAVSGLV